LSNFLGETGTFQIEEYAFDGQQALDLTMKLKPDLLILDLIMPILDGFAVLEEMVKNGYDADTRIVMTSALSLDFIFKKAEGYGVDYIFIKPFDRDVFKKRVAEIMAYNGGKTFERSRNRTRSLRKR
jgi:two-component system response regulator (stage 0 sporulation protein A)